VGFNDAHAALTHGSKKKEKERKIYQSLHRLLKERRGKVDRKTLEQERGGKGTSRDRKGTRDQAGFQTRRLRARAAPFGKRKEEERTGENYTSFGTGKGEICVKKNVPTYRGLCIAQTGLATASR